MPDNVTKMAYVNKEAWHGLGTKLTPDASLEKWREEAGFDWNAESSPVMYNVPGGVKEMPGRLVLRRSDNDYPLSIVSPQYRPHQPGEILQFFHEYVEQLGAFTLEVAGCLGHGRKIWALAAATDDLLDLGDGDKLKRYLLLATSYDFSLTTVGAQTSTRVVCENTLEAALRMDKTAQLRITHRQAFNVDQIKLQMATFNADWITFSETIQRLRDKQWNEAQTTDFFNELICPQEELDKLMSQKTRDKKVAALMEINRSAPGQELSTARNTVWGAVNAVTYFVDHAARSRTADSRLDKAWFGEGRRLKALAMKRAAAVVGVKDQ